MDLSYDTNTMEGACSVSGVSVLPGAACAMLYTALKLDRTPHFSRCRILSESHLEGRWVEQFGAA